jgi:hypothetical protein
MSEVYTAVIFDREREVLGWTDKGNLAIGDGIIENLTGF